MSIYPDKESYSQSKIVAVIGPIECWWDTEEEPDRFNSLEARSYRDWRRAVCDALAKHFLVYRPHEAFKGNWNEEAQLVNDAGIDIAHYVVNLKPENVVALGTDHEEERARKQGKHIFYAPPPNNVGSNYAALANEFARTLDMALRTLVH
jgi:hypothetical protein